MSKRDQVYASLSDMLEGLEVGDALPAERELAARLGVSRQTLRGVVDEMVRTGLLRRRHGSGTYVADSKVSGPLTMTSFSDDMRSRGMEPSSRALSFETIDAGARLGPRLQLSPAAPVWAIKRLRLANGEPMAIETLYVSKDLLPELQANVLESGSFYELLDSRGIAIAKGTQTIEATVTTDEEAAILDVPLYAPALLFERLSRTEEGTPVEFVRSVYRGDRYQLTTELQANPLAVSR